MAQAGIPSIACTNCADLIASGDSIGVIARGEYGTETTIGEPSLLCGTCTAAADEALEDLLPQSYGDIPVTYFEDDEDEEPEKAPLLPGYGMTAAEYDAAAKALGYNLHVGDPCDADVCSLADEIRAMHKELQDA